MLHNGPSTAQRFALNALVKRIILDITRRPFDAATAKPRDASRIIYGRVHADALSEIDEALRAHPAPLLEMVFSSVPVKVTSVLGAGMATLNVPTTEKLYVRSVSDVY